VDKTNKNWGLVHGPFRDRKTNPEIWRKIGRAYFELIGLTGIVIFKMNNLTEAEHNKILPAFGRLNTRFKSTCFRQPGRLKKITTDCIAGTVT